MTYFIIDDRRREEHHTRVVSRPTYKRAAKLTSDAGLRMRTVTQYRKGSPVKILQLLPWEHGDLRGAPA